MRIEESHPGSSSNTDAIATMDLDSLSRCFAGFPDPVVLINSRQQIIFLNPAAEELLGCSVARGRPCPPCTEILQSKSGEEGSVIEPCLRGRENLNRMPVQLVNTRGERFSSSVSAALIRDHSGNPAGCLAIFRDIKTDLEAQPEIQVKIATLSSMLDNFPTPLFTVDSNLVITYMNEQMEKLTGYTRQEVVNRMTCASVLRTAQCQTEACLLMQAMKRSCPIAGIRRVVVDRQGREIPVVANASIITDSTGEVIGGFEAVRDITRIVEAEEKIEQLAEITREGILMADENHRVIFANSRMAEITGVPKKDLVGMGVSEVLSPQHQEMMAELLKETEMEADLEGKEHLRFCSSLRSDPPLQETFRAFETCMAVSRVGRSKITYIYLRDLTERVEIERRLRNAYNFLNNIIQSSVDGIVVTNVKGTVVVFNEGAERILGFNAEEIIGKVGAFHKFCHPDVAHEMMRRLQSNEYGPPGKLNPSRICLLDKSGEEVPVNYSAAAIKVGAREIGTVSIFSDLREQERMRQELADLRESERMRRELEKIQRQLVQAEKIASLGRLAAGVAHEINNPLAGVLIYADMLMKEIKGNERWRQDLEEIVNQTLRCKQIVSRLLEFSRQSLGQRVLFDVNEVIGHSVELLGHQALFHNIEIVQQLGTDLPQVLGNPGEIEQVFTNLMLNAADAMEGRGRIIISSELDPKESQLLLKVSDTGPGIPAETRGKIFEPFFTTKPLGVGTGLGLSVVYGVIQRHGGTIEVESPPDGGAAFIIRLPLEAPEGAFQVSAEDWPEG